MADRSPYNFTTNWRVTPPGPAVQSRPAPPARTTASAEKLAWLLGVLEAQRALATTTIPRERRITPEAFLDRHYAANWPLLLEDALEGWPALERWTPAYLKGVIGSAEVQVQANRAADEDYERRMPDHSERMAFDVFIDRITSAAGNDLYLTAYNAAANADALAPLHADLGFLDALLDPRGGAPRGMMWIGPAGTFTPLHHDLTNNLLLQLVGRKELLLVSPSETPKLYNDHHVYSGVRDLDGAEVTARFPDLAGVRVHRVTMNPGDALFIPIGWWHQVRALDFSVTITHTNFRWPNDLHVGHPS